VVYASSVGTDEGYNYPYGFDIRDGEKRWDAGQSLGGGGFPILMQGNGIWMMSSGSTASVVTESKDTGQEIWSYDLSHGVGGSAFAADGNRVFVATGDSVCAHPVF
jgi:outer membrane protein assembly factor BamB